MAEKHVVEEGDLDMVRALHRAFNGLRNKTGGKALHAVPARQEPARDAE